MKRAVILSLLGLSLLLLVFSNQKFLVKKPAQRVNKSLWAKKQKTVKPTKALWVNVPPEAWGEPVDLDVANKALGFNIKLPQDPRTTAAGQPKIYVQKGVKEYVQAKGSIPKPNNPIQSGAFVGVYYPNGLIINISIRHPQDPTKNYQRHVESENSETIYWSKKGYKDGKLFELTTVNGYEGIQIDKGFNFVGSLGVNGMPSDTPTDELKEPRPAVIIWYDKKNWAEYDVRAPLGVPLKELREIVASMFN